MSSGPRHTQKDDQTFAATYYCCRCFFFVKNNTPPYNGPSKVFKEEGVIYLEVVMTNRNQGKLDRTSYWGRRFETLCVLGVEGARLDELQRGPGDLPRPSYCGLYRSRLGSHNLLMGERRKEKESLRMGVGMVYLERGIALPTASERRDQDKGQEAACGRSWKACNTWSLEGVCVFACVYFFCVGENTKRGGRGGFDIQRWLARIALRSRVGTAAVERYFWEVVYVCTCAFYGCTTRIFFFCTFVV